MSIDYTTYIRSYLGDSDEVIDQGIVPAVSISQASAYLNYIASYLGDLHSTTELPRLLFDAEVGLFDNVGGLFDDT